MPCSPGQAEREKKAKKQAEFDAKRLAGEAKAEAKRLAGEAKAEAKRKKQEEKEEKERAAAGGDGTANELGMDRKVCTAMRGAARCPLSAAAGRMHCCHADWRHRGAMGFSFSVPDTVLMVVLRW